MADAEALEAAGCFAVIGEMVHPEVSRSIAQKLNIPLSESAVGPIVMVKYWLPMTF